MDTFVIVQFSSKVPPGDRIEYVAVVKNQWKYSSVSNFLSEILWYMKNDGLIILKTRREVVDNLMKAVKKRGYATVEGWLESKIAEEIRDAV